MKVIIAPDSFKGSLKAKEVAENIEIGISKVYKNIDIIKLPLADGGEGTVEAIVEATNGKIIKKIVTSPLGKKVNSFFGILPDNTAVIEMAAASGLSLVPKNKQNPSITTTYGTGELIKEALNYNVNRIIVGIGDSATNDAGCGCMQALGIKFLDNSKEIGFGGYELKKIKRIDISGLDKRVKKVEFIVASDVKNPLCGKEGAAYTYARQKGADDNMIKELDKALLHFANVVKHQLNKDIKDIPGVGAAGGFGAGLITFLDAKIESGFDIISKLIKLEEKIKGASLIITAEGKLDKQTIYGKVPYRICKLAKKYNIPVIGIAGSIEDKELLLEAGFDAVFSFTNSPMSLSKAIKNTKVLLQDLSEQIMRVIKLINL